MKIYQKLVKNVLDGYGYLHLTVKLHAEIHALNCCCCCFLKKGKTGKKGKKSKEKLPPAPFTLSAQDMKAADKRASNVQVPVDYGWKPGPLFLKYSYKKSHDMKLVCI